MALQQISAQYLPTYGLSDNGRVAHDMISTFN